MADRYYLEQTSEFERGAGCKPYPVHVYKHKQTEFRVVVCPIAGLICNLTVCMPTLCSDHKGTAHTLEHLVFCGSQKHPYRGYIDALASNNLGQPLNASTHKDMTLYKFVGLCQEGAANVLPAVLDHIMHPTLHDNHFATEVYHIDHDGRQQGVVLSEMQDFAYKEESARTLSLEQMLYQPSSTYAWAHGGLPQSIETLTRNEVIDYHKLFYNYNNATLILVGAFDEHPAPIFDALAKIDDDICASAPLLKRPMPPLRAKKEKRRADLVFASANSLTGSMGFAWEGPAIEDTEEQTALEMLFDYLVTDPESPLRKRFTNRPVPIAGDIKLGLRGYFPTMIELSFTEVPFSSYVSHAAAAAAASSPTKRRDVYSSSSYPSPTDTFGPLDLAKLHDDTNSLFASNYYRKQLISTLTYIIDHWLPDHWSHFCSYMAKRVDELEGVFAKNTFDDKHAKSILQMLARDAVAYHYSPGSAELPQPDFSAHKTQFSARRQLINEKTHEYWQSIMQKWLLNNQMVHLAMIPDPKMCIQIEAERNLAQRNRIERMSSEELASMQKRVSEAIASTKICIPREVLAQFPPIPDISKVQIPQATGHSFALSGADHTPSPFGTGRMLAVSSSEKGRFQISLPLAGLPSNLRPYLPLFAKLLSSSTGLIIPRCLAGNLGQGLGLPIAKPTEMPFLYLNNEQVDKALSDAFEEYSAFIGEHTNRNCTGHWPVEVLTLFGQIPADGLQKAFALLALKLLFGDFGVDAIYKTAVKEKKLLQSKKGTPSSLLIDTFQWIRTPGSLDAQTLAAADANEMALGSAKPVSMSAWSTSESFGRTLNLYYQSSFIDSVTAALDAAIAGDEPAAGQTGRIGDCIMRIRAHFAHCIAGSGLIHVAWPKPMTSDSAKAAVTALASDWSVFAEIWRQNHQLSVVIPDSPPLDTTVHYRINTIPDAPPRKKRRGTMEMAAKGAARALSASSRLAGREFVKLAEPLGIHIALSSLHTSYVGIQIPLNIQERPLDTSTVSVEKQLESLPAIDYYSLCVMTIILNRSEGLLKNAIRSRGHAYGLGMHPKCEDGHLSVYISHAVDPIKAMEAVWEIMEYLATDEGWNESIDDFQLNSARSTFLFRAYNGFPQSMASEDAFSLLCGFSGIEQSLLWMRKHIESITTSSLRRAFNRCLLPLVSRDKSVPMLYIIATPASYAEPAGKFVGKLNDNPYGISFKPMQFSVLDPLITI
ncbi:hypothetical protein H4R99_006703 [Coemansia sp. RSA 1722]|nr:hypothetical protein IWW45_007506 [Coemansia sp. RSA 485]KAJ2591576.1 hypothetical protein H4R99_006703 [Coemansia sp. RSA 1722]